MSADPHCSLQNSIVAMHIYNYFQPNDDVKRCCIPACTFVRLSHILQVCTYRAVKYRHFRNDSLSTSGASSARCIHLHSYRDTGYMRTYDRTCDRICCKIRILHIFPHIIAFSKLHTRKLCRICENSHIFAHLRICMHAIAFFSQLQTVKCTITRHTVRYRLLIKD